MAEKIKVIPTLVQMAEIYRLPLEGGASSPRFKRYVDLIPRHYGLAAYKPIAGPLTTMREVRTTARALSGLRAS